MESNGELNLLHSLRDVINNGLRAWKKEFGNFENSNGQNADNDVIQLETKSAESF